MGIKLGDVSPLAGMLTGKGAMGKLAATGALGPAGMLMARHMQKKDARAAAEEAARTSKGNNVGSVGTVAKKSGGVVKGWGKARGGKSCKMR